MKETQEIDIFLSSSCSSRPSWFRSGVSGERDAGRGAIMQNEPNCQTRGPEAVSGSAGRDAARGAARAVLPRPWGPWPPLGRLRQTNPIGTGVMGRTSAVRERSYGHLYRPRASAKQSQFSRERRMGREALVRHRLDAPLRETNPIPGYAGRGEATGTWGEGQSCETNPICAADPGAPPASLWPQAAAKGDCAKRTQFPAGPGGTRPGGTRDVGLLPCPLPHWPPLGSIVRNEPNWHRRDGKDKCCAGNDLW
jgi:hypothetical protein